MNLTLETLVEKSEVSMLIRRGVNLKNTLSRPVSEIIAQLAEALRSDRRSFGSNPNNLTILFLLKHYKVL